MLKGIYLKYPQQLTLKSLKKALYFLVVTFKPYAIRLLWHLFDHHIMKAWINLTIMKAKLLMWLSP
nr:hypothetical protein BCU57_01930 [Shewanella sp. 10N.286.48.B5]